MEFSHHEALGVLVTKLKAEIAQIRRMLSKHHTDTRGLKDREESLLLLVAELTPELRRLRALKDLEPANPGSLPKGASASPEIWRGLSDEFSSLSAEQRALRSTRDVWLSAQPSEYGKDTDCGLWCLSGGLNEDFKARFMLISTRAGVALGSPADTKPIEYWLSHTARFLTSRRSNQVETRIASEYGVSRETIRFPKASIASELYCAQLEKEALEQSSRTAAVHNAQPSRLSSLGSNGDVQREAVIAKVKNPQKYTVLTIAEVGIYFGVKARTVYRWRKQGDLRSSARRGSITISSVISLQKKRARKLPK